MARRLLPVVEAATYLGVSRASVETLGTTRGTPFVTIGGSTRYDIGDSDGFIDAQKRRNRRR
jgi:hypothetical protein